MERMPAHLGNGLGQVLGRLPDFRRDLQNFFHIPVHGVADIFPPTVFMEAFVHFLANASRLSSVEFIVQQFGGF